MTVQILGITPKPQSSVSDSIAAHLSIESFKWTNDQTKQSGISSRQYMFDWIVNNKGVAYIRADENKDIFVFGANSLAGKYIRALEDGKWTDSLLKLPDFTK